MSKDGKQCSDDSQWCEHASQCNSENSHLSPLDPKWCQVEILERTEEGVIKEVSDMLSLNEQKMWRITNLICDERQKE